MSYTSQSMTIITVREVEVIREYINLSMRLRADYENMKRGSAFTTLSSQCGLGTALDEQGVNDLISAVINHAGRWSGIEAEMRALCNEVFMYSDNFTTVSAGVVAQIKTLPGYAAASAALDVLPDYAWEGAVIPLSEEDFTHIPSIKQAISNMSGTISALKVMGEALRVDIVNFKIDMMNTIQTSLRKITQMDTIHELEEELSRIGMNEDDRLIVRGHMHNITSAFEEVVTQSYIREGKVPNMMIVNYHKDDYDRILQGLPSVYVDTIHKLVLKMRSGVVLTQHFSTFHDAVERLDAPLESADKGIGQLRTLWTLTLDIVQGAQDRILQVTSISTIKNIEKSLVSAAERWVATRKNAEALWALLSTPI